MTTKSSDVLVGKQATDVKINLLSNAITTMDAVSQEAFEEIAAISRLAGDALKNSGRDVVVRFEHIIVALRAIRLKAEDAMNTINSEAEQVGCNYRDEVMQ